MPFLHVTCPSCSTDLKVPPEAAGKRVRCSTCKNVMAVPAAEPAVNYVVNFADEPPPVRYRPEPEDVETSPEPRRVRPAPPPASLRFPATVLGVATVWLLVVVVLWFVLETPSGDVATQTIAAPRAVARVEHRPPPAGNFVEAMREFGQRMEQANAKANEVDWSKVGSTARVEDLVFTITSTSLIRQGLAAVPDELRVFIRIDNHSRTRIYEATGAETKSFTDGYGNPYKSVSGSHWLARHEKVIPGGSINGWLFFEYPEDVSKRFRLTLYGSSFGLSGNVHLAFDRPTTLIDHRAKRRE